MYLYYNQPKSIDFLRELGAENYQCNFLFVDDGSKVPLKLDWPNAKVLRIEEDIPWNMSTANNLGFRNLAPESYVLRSDMDHFFTKEQVDQLNSLELGTKEIMKFKRSNAKDYPPNIYLAKVKDLLDAGGYSEEFCGNYGYEDKEFLRRLTLSGMRCTGSPFEIYVHMGMHTVGLDRSTSVNLKKYKNLINEKT